MDLSRYRDDVLDDAIATVIREAAAGESGAWTQVQEQLTELDCYTLLTFANRRAAVALRTGMGAFAAEAIRGLALIATKRVDYRDLTVDFPVYALRRTSDDFAGSLAFAFDRSQSDMRDQFESRVNATLSLHDCGLIEVRSRHGLGFMQTWWRPPPQSLDLPIAAIAVADRIDEGGRYAVESTHISSLPWVWFDRSRRADEIPTSGCVSISASLQGTPRHTHRFLVFLADVAEEATARTLADLARAASRESDPQTAFSRGSRVLTVIGDWATARDGPAETQASLTTIASALADAAFDSAPSVA
jgi:hypothetical protein